MFVFKRLTQAIVATLCVFALSSCASGQKFSEMSSSMPKTPTGQGRIYIYRTSALGAAIQPSIKVDGEVVGSAVPQGFVYVDRPAGNHEISASTEVKRTLSLTLAPGDKRYVRMDVSFGFFAGHIYPVLVEPAEGEAAIKNLHYIGK